jgi:hypothetical protein
MLIIPNPFAAPLDVEGRPMGRTLVDPAHPRPFEIYGGKLARKVLRHENEEDLDRKKARSIDMREARVKAIAEVRMRPTRVTLSQYVRERVLSGDLIAADLETALACGMSRKDFLPPIDVLRRAMTARLAEWRATHDPTDLPAIHNFVLVAEGAEIKLCPAPKLTVAAPIAPSDPPAPAVDDSEQAPPPRAESPAALPASAP